MPKLSTAAFLPLLYFLTAAAPPQQTRWKDEASRVTIRRDDWGIAHVHGKTDADAVFGMIYAQAEDDFPRIEANYLTALGRTAEAEGEKAIWQDLRARLYVGESELKADYARSTPQMRKLMDAWADGLNYFLATHHSVHPRVLTHFEPWMALSFTEGSIGGDIERIDLKQLEAQYGGPRTNVLKLKKTATAGPRLHQDGDAVDRERQASNGIAIAPKITAAGGALLLINPHTSWYFRSEQQVSSDEGLNAYGAATWGQFFIYQGFNEHAGWMHTSSGIDVVDEFYESLRWNGKQPTGLCYVYGRRCLPLRKRTITIKSRKPDGRLAQRKFVVWGTHHGPIVRDDALRLMTPISFAMMNKPVEALQQSFLRTKATDLSSFLRIADRFKANSSNNTLFADDKGEIAYLHPQFVPRRENRFDFTKPVDGSDPATDWHGLHALRELPSLLNPPNGWVQNTNSWPYRAAGKSSPDPAKFPKYMDMVGGNFREVHALQLLSDSGGWTAERLQAAAYDSYQPGFAALLPLLLQAHEALPQGDPFRNRLAGPIGLLRSWDFRWSADSVAQSLAVYWGEALIKALDPPASEDKNRYMDRIGHDTTPSQKLQALDTAVAELTRDFGRWQVPWSEINRFQRISPSITPQFDDEGPSIPVPFAAAKYGSLASMEMRGPKTTRHIFGNYGNSFVAVVEFGKRVGARAVTAGGESGAPKSPHFTDQIQRYASGNLREVYFYADQLRGHTERVYRPGD